VHEVGSFEFHPNMGLVLQEIATTFGFANNN
jgi:hypothetical protein